MRRTISLKWNREVVERSRGGGGGGGGGLARTQIYTISHREGMRWETDGQTDGQTDRRTY